MDAVGSSALRTTLAVGVWAGVAFVSSVPGACALVLCQSSEGGVDIEIEITSHDDGDSFAATDTCEIPITVSGTFSVEAPPGFRDFYLVLDRSGSTDGCSQVDVDGDGQICPGRGLDSIYQAELRAAELFVQAINQFYDRVALIMFESSAMLEAPLQANWLNVWNTIQVLKQAAPGGGTAYAPALRMMRDEVLTRGDPDTHSQWGIFISDGNPGDGAGEIFPVADELAALGVSVDTFDLDPDDSVLLMLPDIAQRTGGVFHNLDLPGDIIQILPSLAVNYRFTGVDPDTGDSLAVEQDRDAGTWELETTLRAGTNVIVLEIATTGGNPIVLECPIELHLTLPSPQDVDKALRVRRSIDPAVDPLLVWDTAPALRGIEEYRIYRSADRVGPFREAARTTAQVLPAPAGASASIVYYDVRTSNCADEVTVDPYPPQTAGLASCWSPPGLTSGYPVASNLTDPACASDHASHACEPGLALGGVDRAFPFEVAAAGRLSAALSDPDLYVALYDPTGACAALGRGEVDTDAQQVGTWTAVVDAEPGSEGPFDLRVDLR